MRISEWLYSISNGWIALFALLVFVLFAALVLPGQTKQSEAYSGDAGSPDTSLFYSAVELYDMAEGYGQEGRQAYVRARFTFDLVFPLVYTMFLATATSWVYGMTFAVRSRWRLANLAPLMGMLLDYLENLATSLVMWRYPAHTLFADSLAPAFTLAKWVFVGGSFVLLAVGGVAAIWRRSRARG